MTTPCIECTVNIMISYCVFCVLEEKFKDTKGVIRSRKSQDRQHNGLELEDIKGVTRSRKSRYQRGNQKL